MDDQELTARRLGDARAFAAAVIAAILALVLWSGFVPAMTSASSTFGTDDYFAHSDALRGVLIGSVAAAVGTFGVVWLVWSKVIEARRIGDRASSPRRPRDRWAWLVFYPLGIAFLWFARPFETFMPITDFSLATGAWAIYPANAARWFILGLAAWSLVEIGWMWLIDSRVHVAPNVMRLDSPTR